VFVIDTMGELLKFYAASDVAFVGGSLEPIGGHNVLEPAALGRPVLVGPYTFNFAEITENLIAAGGAERAQDGIRLGAEVARILSDPGRLQAMGEIGAQVVERERGAIGRIIRATESVIEDGPRAATTAAAKVAESRA
jgi:3-deoxy-D-manno-octulosonic-acid transferase